MMSNSKYVLLFLFPTDLLLASTEGKYYCFHSFSYNAKKNISEIKVGTPKSKY